MFYDGALTFPKIDTLVYIGRDTDGAYQFQDAASYSAQQDGEQVDGGDVCLFSSDALTDILDKEHLVDWLQDEHSAAMVGPTYQYREVDRD